MTLRRFTLVLRDEPRALDDPAPVEIRLRAALKRLLRSYGFRAERCVELNEPPTEEQQAKERGA